MRSPEVVAAIRAAYLRGEPMRDIAATHGVNRSTLFELIADLPRRRRHLEARRVKIVACLDAGIGVAETVAATGCTEAEVLRVMAALKRASRRPLTDEDRRAKKRARYLANRDIILRRSRERYAANREVICEQRRRWYSERRTSPFWSPTEPPP